MPSVIIAHNPFEPLRQIREPLRSAVTIRGWIRRHQKRVKLVGKPFIALINGEAVLRKHWARKIRQGETLAFVALPAGGGDGKNPIATVLSLALLIAAPVLAGAILKGATLTGTALTIATSAITAGIGLAGSLLIGALFPPSTPSLPEFGNTPAASPTYSLQARGNSARLGQPIPVIYGNHKIYPDLAAAPWVNYAGNEQYLHQLFMVGQGEYDVTNIAIDDTPIANFAEITHEIIRPGGSITLFDPDYITAPELSGQQLFAGKAVGGFIINPADTRTTEIQIDIVAPSGIFHANNDGSLNNRSVIWKVEARQIDDDGVAIGNWTQLAQQTLTAATNTPQRRTYIYSVASGRYQVRLTRTSAESSDRRISDTIHWQAARAKLSRKINTTGVTMIAMRMRATNNLSNQSRRLVSLTAQRKLPIWNGSRWTQPQATRSIAWAIADIARASYGGKLVDSRIDLAALKSLDDTLNARGDYFDAVFDSAITVWEALNRAARCGRAGCFLQGGILRTVRDQEQTLPVAMFTPRNIVKDSLNIEYRLSDENTASAIKAQFHNRRSWLNDTATVSIDNDTTEPASVTLFGITQENHAKREAAYLGRANRYRRKQVTFRTELEGLIPTYGDLIRITHQQPNWGIGGEIIAYDSTTRTLTLSEPPIWHDATQGHIMLRANNGSVQGTWQVTKGNLDHQVILPEGANVKIETTGNKENTHFAFALSQTKIGLDARVINIKPRGQSQIEITAIAEDSRVHLE